MLIYGDVDVGVDVDVDDDVDAGVISHVILSYCLLHKQQTGECFWSLLRMQLIHTRLVVLINTTMTKERVLIYNLHIR